MQENEKKEPSTEEVLSTTEHNKKIQLGSWMFALCVLLSGQNAKSSWGHGCLRCVLLSGQNAKSRTIQSDKYR